MDRHDLTDAEWAIIAPLLPNKIRTETIRSIVYGDAT